MNAPSPSPLRLLLLEDSRFDAELVGEAVRATYPAATMQVVAGEPGFAAALRGATFDVVLSDYELPGYSGLDALDLARREAPATPFIFVSGVIGEENAVDMLKRGATDYVSKNRLSRLPVVIERALREVAERDARGRAERQLREADAIYARVVDSLQDYAVVLLDRYGAIRDWNRGAEAIFGLTRAQALGTSVARLFVEEDRSIGVVELELRQARESGSASDDRWLQRADGARLRAEGVLTALRDARDGQITGYCKIVRDVTRAYEHAAAVRAAKDEAVRANQAKDRFIAVLSHELRTPLTPIAAAAKVLELRATVPSEHADLIPMIRRNVALESRLIDDLLDVSTIATGKVALKKEVVDLRRVVDDVFALVADDARQKSIDVRAGWATAAAQVEGDPARLQQVLWNLVRNAIKFTPEGGAVTIAVDDDGAFVRLRCVDTGIGIARDALPRIFAAFEQADGDVTREYGGLGLGLAIARGLVDEHGGTLEAASDGPGRGATFTVRLPRVAVAAPATPAGAAADREAPAALHVLLVEDNADAAYAMQMSFEMQGHRVEHAATLRDALRLAQDGRFDVVVSDLGLPDGHGTELGAVFAGRVPLVALTGFGSAEDVARTRAAGFAAHLVKPADPDEIDALVRRLVRESRGAASPL